MRTRGVARFYVHKAVVETYEGTNGYGEDTFAAPVTLDPAAGNGCFVDDTQHLVRTSDTEQVLSNSTLYTYPANAALFTPDSRVTVNGVVARVIKANTNDAPGLNLPDHIAITLE